MAFLSCFQVLFFPGVCRELPSFIIAAPSDVSHWHARVLCWFFISTRSGYSETFVHCLVFTWSVRKVSDLWPGKRNWLTWSVGHL